MSTRLFRHNKASALHIAAVLLMLVTQFTLAAHYPVHVIEDVPTVVHAQQAGHHGPTHHHGAHHICPVCFLGDMMLKTLAAAPVVLPPLTSAWARPEVLHKRIAARATARVFDAQGPPAQG